jgi:hypothetical protein
VKVLPSGFRQDGPRSRDELAQRGERLRRLFELRIDAREAEAA